MEDLGRDFASGSGVVDASRDQKGINAKDITLGASVNATADLDGKGESLGNDTLRNYGIGDTWSIAAWVRPAKLSVRSKPRYVINLNGKSSTETYDEISLTIDSGGHFAIEVSDIFGRARALSAPAGIVPPTKKGDVWYHVAAVKNANRSLTLYVNGIQVASSVVGVPSQADLPRAMRIGGRVKSSSGRYFKGGIGSVGIWRTALRPSEVSALMAGGIHGALRPLLISR